VGPWTGCQYCLRHFVPAAAPPPAPQISTPMTISPASASSRRDRPFSHRYWRVDDDGRVPSGWPHQLLSREVGYIMAVETGSRPVTPRMPSHALPRSTPSRWKKGSRSCAPLPRRGATDSVAGHLTGKAARLASWSAITCTSLHELQCLLDRVAPAGSSATILGGRVDPIGPSGCLRGSRGGTQYMSITILYLEHHQGF